MYQSPYAYLIAHLNLALKNDKRIHRILCTKKTLKLMRVLRQEGCVTYLIPRTGSVTKKYMLFTPYFYKQTTFFKCIRLISTISKKFTVTLKALIIINRSLKSSILLIETSKGILTHKDALRLRVGGLLLCVIS